MIGFPQTPEFLGIAKRVVWFKPPEEALQYPYELMAYAMKASPDEDLAALIRHIGVDGLREAIENAPAGIIDARSWSYWNLMAGFEPELPRPARTIGGVTVSHPADLGPFE